MDLEARIYRKLRSIAEERLRAELLADFDEYVRRNDIARERESDQARQLREAYERVLKR